MTFSIVGRAGTGVGGAPEWGVAVASKFLAVGSAVPAAVAGIGAVATQAQANVAWKAEGLALLDDGASASVALDRLVADDELPSHRQAGIVDLEGNAATYTGGDCFDWAGGLAEPGVAVQGNILAGPQVVDAMLRTWRETEGEPLSRRLLAALAAGDEAGGDRRGRQSAALLVVSEGAGYGGGDDVAVDLRVDDHPDPVAELTRLLGIHALLNQTVPEEDREPDSPELLAELDGRARSLGHGSFIEWVGTNNFEALGGSDWTSRRVIGILRDQTPQWRPETSG